MKPLEETADTMAPQYMKCLSAALLAVLFLSLGSGVAPAGEEVTVGGVVHVRNEASPRDGLHTRQLQEMWRAGGEDDDETIFGIVSKVLTNDDGDIFLLDQQLSEVQVYSQEGEYLRALSREGEGPGEVRSPRDMLFLPDGTLGIVQPMPGKIVKVNLDGTPSSSIVLNDPMEGGRHALYGAQSRSGRILVCANDMTRKENSMARTRYLASIDEDGVEQVRYLESTIERDFRGFQWIEEDEYFVHFGRCGLAPDGRVYAAPHRDSYTIHVYRPDGALERVIEREFTPRKRTPEDVDRIKSTRRIRVRGPRGGQDIEQVISGTDPCVSRLRVDDDGSLWVLSSRGDREQPDGVFSTFDIFDPAGHFVRQVAFACPGDPQEDGFFLLGSNRAIVVRGLVDAIAERAGVGSGEEQAESEEHAAPLEVICYSVVDVAEG